MDVTTVARQLAGSQGKGALLELPLREGVEIVVRVQQAPAGGGRGTISLAGILLSATLPAGLETGQRLPVKVGRVTANEVVLQLHTGAQAEEGSQAGASSRLAGAYALSGDPRLVELATQLQQPGLALPLPNGDALVLAIPPEPEDEQGSGEPQADGDGEAAFVLHSASLGPIEVRLRLSAGALGVDVAVDREAEAVARAAAPELVQALEQAVAGTPVRVAVTSRSPAAPRPRPPRVEESFDAYA